MSLRSKTLHVLALTVLGLQLTAAGAEPPHNVILFVPYGLRALMVTPERAPTMAAIRDEGVTVLLVEQDVQLALSGADRGYVLETGRIVHSGPASVLIDDPAVRQAYLGL